jgi:hypothetical protein
MVRLTPGAVVALRRGIRLPAPLYVQVRVRARQRARARAARGRGGATLALSKIRQALVPFRAQRTHAAFVRPRRWRR